MHRRGHLKAIAAAAAIATGALTFANHALAADTIKVGVLHSLSGTMVLRPELISSHYPMLSEAEHGVAFQNNLGGAYT